MNMECKYCNKNESLYYDCYEEVQEVVIEDDRALSIIYLDNGFNIAIPIKYCPMCGRRLKEDL